MKTAREVARATFDEMCEDEAEEQLTTAIEQARRDGAEQMREHIAIEAEKRQLGNFAIDIRAMPVTP